MGRKKTFDIKKKAFNVLKANAPKRLTSKEIGFKINEMYPEECAIKLSKSDSLENNSDLVQQLAREVGAVWKAILRDYPKIRSTENRPREFYYTEQSEEEELSEELDTLSKDADTTSSPQQQFNEQDLYPVLGDYVFQELGCVSMRINESRSSNKRGKKGNQWLFPDTVGMINLSENWHSDVIDVADSLAAERVHLCSFEVKKKINRSNVREVVFQTVSNSTWANYAYLASVELDSNANDELRLLCLAHNIGYISLKLDDPSESQILIPAKLQENINFDTLSRLAEENPDAREYLENVTAFVRTKRLRSRDWNLLPAEID